MSVLGNNLFAEYYAQNQGLPFGYEAVEYLESTGTQIIDTEIKWSYNISTDVNCSVLPVATSQFVGVISAKNATNIVWGGCFVRYSNLLTYNSFGSIVDRTFNLPSVASFFDVFHEQKTTNDGFYLDGEKMVSLSDSNQSLVSNNNIGIFARFNGFGAKERFGYFKIKTAKIFDENALVRNFIPCVRKSDGKPGLYDLCRSICPLTGTPFYINAGTGEFVTP